MDDFIQLIPKSYGLKKRLTQRHDKVIVFRHGHIAITDYHMGDNREFEKSLSTWDKVCFKYNLVGGYYVKDLHEFRINRGYDFKMLKRYFPNYQFVVDNDAYPADKVSSELYAEPRDDFQKVALAFMTSNGKYESNSKYSQIMIDAQTGLGKSYAGVATSIFFNSKVVIILPISKLLEQWKKSYLDFTDMTEDEIMIVQGSKACEKILEGKCKHVKVFIFMEDTILSFHEAHGDLAVIDMMAATGAYMKIVDEVHRNIKTVSMIEALCNFRMNYYMSASPGRAESKENWIFNTLFFNVPRFGNKFQTSSEKHINVMIKNYTFIPDSRQIGRMVNPKTGLNTKAYERELINADKEQRADFDNSLKVMMNWAKSVIHKDCKILILGQSIDFLHYIADQIEDIFPDEIGIYYGGLKKTEKEEALKSKVIVATSSSLGTGADIKGIQVVCNCGTYANKIDATQLPGRAREIKGLEVVYIELVNMGYRKTVMQFEKRKPHLLKIAKGNKLIVVR